MKAVSLWSGGKDSCFACYRAKESGFEIKDLINFISEDTKKSFSHNLDAQLVLEQANATGINLIQKKTSKGIYGETFKKTILKLKREGVETAVFGDIYLKPHKDWIEKICAEVDINPVLPLWGKDTAVLIREFVDCGFEAIIVRVKEGILNKGFLGRKIDNTFIKNLSSDKNIDPCGERGEFHTLVVNGPLFKKRIEITKSAKRRKEGCWFLDVLEWKII